SVLLVHWLVATWSWAVPSPLLGAPAARATNAFDSNSSRSANAHDGVWERTPLVARFAHAAVYDPVGDRMLVMGGSDGDHEPGETWALPLSGAPVWHRVSGAG